MTVPSDPATGPRDRSTRIGPDPAGIIASHLRRAGCVFAEEEAVLILAAARTPAERDEMVARRSNGVPLEVVVGRAEFCGLQIMMDPGVFAPRRRSEFLTRQAVALARTFGCGAVAVDLCCGSGAIAVVLRTALPDVELYAADSDPAAVSCARRNLGHGAQVFEGDLYGSLPPRLSGHIDLVVANAPYVPTDLIALLPAEARLYEPRTALDGGVDGLDIHRRLAAGAPSWLADGGALIVETSDTQRTGTAEIFQAQGLASRTVECPETGAVVVIGTTPTGLG